MAKGLRATDLTVPDYTQGRRSRHVEEPEPLTKVDRSFLRLIENLTEAKEPRDWQYRMRPSMLPVCQWHTMLALLHGRDKLPQDRSKGFLFDYYVSVGQAVHTVIQRWLGKLGYLFGEYKCSSCGRMQKSLGWPEKCESGCRFVTWEYNEMDLRKADPSGLLSGGKCDGLIHFKWMEPDHYYLVDIKTSSVKGMPGPGKRFTKAHHLKYLTQTAIYVHLLERMGYQIDGTIFLMVPRDSPHKMQAIRYDQSETNAALFRKCVDDHQAAQEACNTGDATNIVKDCTTRLDNPDCPFTSICFDTKATEELFVKRNGRLPILP